MFPERRLRRLRKSEGMRRLVRETRVTVDDLVCPVFVGEGLDAPKTVGSMSGIRRIPPGMVAEEITEIWEMGIPAVMLFGIPESKDADGTPLVRRGGRGTERHPAGQAGRPGYGDNG